MKNFEFVSHERFRDDPYISEAVTLCFDSKYRVTYIKKKLQNGGSYWDVITASVKSNGDKKYLKSFSQDSAFLQDDIKNFLDARGWEKGKKAENTDEIPF